MAQPLRLFRRRPPDPPNTLGDLSLGDILQRLAVLNPDKLAAIRAIALDVLMEELADQR